MTRHLLELGHRRIGFIVGNPDQTASAERLEGARAAVAMVKGAELVVVPGAFTYASGLRAAEQLLDADRPPTAIFASNDDMAAAAVSVAHRRHLDVPRDLTVVGFDDTTVATTLWPPLTTVRQPVRQMAAVALDRLIRVLRSTDPLGRTVCGLGPGSRSDRAPVHRSAPTHRAPARNPPRGHRMPEPSPDMTWSAPRSVG
jgi:LacI family transcriptional regulator